MSTTKTLIAGARALARYSPRVALAGAGFFAAFTMVSAKMLFSANWSPTLWPQALILFAVTGLAATTTVVVARVLRLNLELSIAVLSIGMIALFCGPAASAVVAYFLLSALCLAAILLRSLGDFDEIPINLLIVVGWATYGILFTILAPLRIHLTAVHTAILAVPIFVALGLPALRHALWSRARSSFPRPADASENEPFYLVGLIACVVILSFHLAEVALPERYYDALVSHLYVPSYVMGHQAWSYDAKAYVFAYMPMTVDFLYTNMFLLQGEQAARLLNFVAMLATCVAIFQIANRSCSRTAAIWGVALFASIPIALIESTSLFVEHTVALFVVSACLAIVLSGFRISLLWHTIVMIALAAATASKLHGAVGALWLGAASFFLYLRYRREFGEYAKFLLVTIVATSSGLWLYFFAWSNTGNPVFPFMNLTFKSQYLPPIDFADKRWVGHLSPWMLFDTTFHSSKFQECADGALGFTLFVFLPAGILAAIYRRNKAALFSVGVGLGAIVLVSLSNQYLRYFYIFVPLLMVGIVSALDDLGRARLYRIAAGVVVFAVTMLNVARFPDAGWVIGASDLRAVFDDEVRRTLILDQVPERIANQAINALAGPSAKVLYFANPFGAFLTGTAVYDNWYNTTYSHAFAEIASEKDVDAIVREIQPTHVIFDTQKVQDPATAERYTVVANYLGREAALVTRVGKLALYRTSFAAQ